MTDRLEQYDTYSIPLKDIYFDASFNSRDEFTIHSIVTLAKSIETDGLQMPIVVQPYHVRKYRIVSGHRRYCAFQYLKRTEIPAQIRTDLTPFEAKLVNLLENIEREDVNIMEEASAIRRLYPSKINVTTIAASVHKPTNWVETRLKLLKTTKEVQEAARAGRLEEADVRKIIKYPNETQNKVLTRILHSKREKRTKKPKPQRRPKNQTRPTTKEITDVILTMLDASVVGIGPRVAAYCLGTISKEALMEDITRLAEITEKAWEQYDPSAGKRDA